MGRTRRPRPVFPNRWSVGLFFQLFLCILVCEQKTKKKKVFLVFLRLSLGPRRPIKSSPSGLRGGKKVGETLS